MGMSEKHNKSSHVEVVHDLVGNYSKGAIVRADRFEHLDHLIAAGAVVYTDNDEESAVPGVRQSLPETLRDGQNVTMPNMPRTDVDPDTVRALMGVDAAEASVTTARTLDADAAAAEKDMHAGRPRA